MAELVGAWAASHGPLIARDWDRLPEQPKNRLAEGFEELGRRFAAARPDILVIVSPDHWVNFFLDNLPSVCLGIGEEHDGPPEPFLRDFPHAPLKGHPAFATHLLRTAIADDFEPSVSHRLRLDHGFCIPLLRMELRALPPIVPLVINDLEPPMPSIRRCLSWGRLLAKAIGSYPEQLRVAVLATGGLSHSIGEPTMGAIDEAFDRACIEAFEDGRDEALIDCLEPGMDAAGNGAHEIRNWIVVHGAAGNGGFDLIDYLPFPEVYVGCAFAEWKLGGAQV